MVKDATLVRKLLESGVHFGHQTKRWNPKMKRYIYGSRSGIYIIDLEKTERQLEVARKFLEDLAARNQVILMIGTKKQARAVVEAEAARCAMPYCVSRWLGGTLTNFNTIKNNINRYLELKRSKEEGEWERLTKKEARNNDRHLERLRLSVGTISTLEGLPACLFVIDPKRETNAVHEANRLKIPIVAICDTNADPDLIAYPIPGNDDAIRSIKLITGMLVDSIVGGRRRAGLPLPSDNAPVEAAQAPAEPARLVPEAA